MHWSLDRWALFPRFLHSALRHLLSIMLLEQNGPYSCDLGWHDKHCSSFGGFWKTCYWRIPPIKHMFNPCRVLTLVDLWSQGFLVSVCWFCLRNTTWSVLELVDLSIQGFLISVCWFVIDEYDKYNMFYPCQLKAFLFLSADFCQSKPTRNPWEKLIKYVTSLSQSQTFCDISVAETTWERPQEYTGDSWFVFVFKWKPDYWS